MVPRYYEPGQSETEHPPTAKDHYLHAICFDAFGLAVTSIADRFDQPAFKMSNSFFLRLLWRELHG